MNETPAYAGVTTLPRKPCHSRESGNPVNERDPRLRGGDNTPAKLVPAKALSFPRKRESHPDRNFQTGSVYKNNILLRSSDKLFLTAGSKKPGVQASGER